MNEINLRQLKIINTLIEYQSAVKAAQVLNISPSAISYSLNQLKKQTGKELFIRTRSGLRPNSHAFELQAKFKEVVQLNSRKNEYVIATYSLIEVLLAEYLHGGEDSLMHFVTMGSGEEERLRKLKHREVDIDIGGKLPDDRSIMSRHFVKSDISIIVSENHPNIKEVFTLDDWRENEHLSWQRGIGSIIGMADNVEPSLLNERKIAWTSPNLLSLAWHCSISDYVMIMPHIFVPYMQKRFPVKSFSPPPELQMTFDCYLHYHLAMEDKISTLPLQNMSSALSAC